MIMQDMQMNKVAVVSGGFDPKQNVNCLILEKNLQIGLRVEL